MKAGLILIFTIILFLRKRVLTLRAVLKNAFTVVDYNKLYFIPIK